MMANRYIRHLLNASKGLVEDDDFINKTKQRSFSSSQQQIFDLEAFFNQHAAKSDFAATFMTLQSSEESNIKALDDIYTSLNAERFDLRKCGLEQLVTMTDMNVTMSSTARTMAKVVPSGEMPGNGQKAQDIHSTIMWVLQNKEFQGDGERFQASDDSNDSMEVDTSFFPSSFSSSSSATISRNRPRYYEQYMDNLFQMTLKVFVQSLEVCTCFQDPFNNDIYQTGGGVDGALKEWIATANPSTSGSMTVSTLACRALRLLSKSDTYLLKSLQEDLGARESIQCARRVGNSHAMLKEESELLWSSIYG